MNPSTPQVLIITGTMGAGKTSVLFEASNLLRQANVPHTAIELDALSLVHDPGRPQLGPDMMLKNLVSVWANAAAEGMDRALIARAIDNQAELDGIKAAIPGGQFTIGRLSVSVSTAEARVRTRDIGVNQQQYVDRVSVLEAELDAVGFESFTVENDGTDLTAVAQEFLRQAGWLA